MVKTIDRLWSYLKAKGVSLNAFDKSIGAANGYIGKQIRNSGSIGSDMMEKIHRTYADLNLNWLLTGEGSMLKEYSREGIREDFREDIREDLTEYTREAKARAAHTPCALCQEKEKVIAAQQRTIDILDRELHHCKVLYDEEREKGHSTPHDGQKRKVG